MVYNQKIFKKISLILILWTAIAHLSFAQKPTKFVKKKIADNTISVNIPDDFTVMGEDVYARKYGAYRQALAMFTSPNAKIDFGVNETVNRSLLAVSSAEFKEEDLKILKDIYKGSIKGMHAEVTFLQDEIVVIDNKKFIALQFVGTVKDDEEKTITMKSGVIKQYSCIYYTVLEGKILVFNFNCPDFFRRQYQPIAQQIMQSIKIKIKKKKK
ncbi:MAG: hypothetical protein EAZ20_00965 [Bacteroidetes bacterium]|nr:MAG: hypothetical protein EAZ20_00965 [Bacteroidota bacterium]